jgi:hypothetical protein
LLSRGFRTQRLTLGEGERTWTVLGRDHRVVGPAEEYLEYLRVQKVSPNTVKSYARALALRWQYLDAFGVAWDARTPNCEPWAEALQAVWAAVPQRFPTVDLASDRLKPADLAAFTLGKHQRGFRLRRPPLPAAPQSASSSSNCPAPSSRTLSATTTRPPAASSERSAGHGAGTPLAVTHDQQAGFRSEPRQLNRVG